MTERAGAAVEGTAKALKRRGLIAGAAALVVGLVAKQAAQPVAAASDGQALIIGGLNTEFSAGTSLTWLGGTLSSGAALSVGDGGSVQPFTAMVAGVATGGKATFGVYGEASSSGVGVHGMGGGVGVRGQGGAIGSTGVIGIGDAIGVQASGTTALSAAGSNIGVDATGVTGVQGQGIGAGGTGVKGLSPSGFPIIGSVQGAGSATNTNAAVTGFGTAGPGVQGQSTGGYGLVGFTNATDGHAALIGYANAAGGIGLIGNAPGGVSPGLAGVFNGDVIVNGALRVFGSPKNAAVKHPGDGTYRLLYCEESPESWFADYGEGKLTNGRADVKLDADFAALVHADAYHVFLTPYGNTNGLHVTGRTAAGFTVEEHNGGKNSLSFSYRVVARRKDIAGERLAKVAPPPPVKQVTPFTIPETPTPQPPGTKP